MNPLYNEMQRRAMPNGNDMMQRFAQFRQNFKGNPQQIVQQMLNSGRVTQQQYDMAVRMANQMMKVIK